MRFIKLIFIAITLLTFNLSSEVNEESEYFGQKRPWIKPELFMPGVVSTGMSELNAVFSPDHNLFYYSIRMPSGQIVIMEMKRKSGKWSSPEVAHFSGKYSDADPFITRDGKWMYFISRRPVSKGADPKRDWDIWRMKRKKNRWGKAERLAEPVNSDKDDLYPGLTKDGTLYFGSRRDGAVRGGDLFYAKKSGKGFGNPVALNSMINSGSEGDLYVAADETYLIFVSRGRSEGSGLYISFRTNGDWGKPVNMGPDINATGGEYCPMVSQDGRYLFFTSSRREPSSIKYEKLNMNTIRKVFDESVKKPARGRGDIYWVDAGVIERYRN